MWHTRDTDVWNRHRESKNTKLYEIGSGTKLFITFELKGFSTWGERHTLSFCADCFYIVSSQPNQRAAPVAHKVVCLAQLCKSTFFFRSRNSTNCFFSNLSQRFWWVTSPKYPGPSSYPGFLFWHPWMTHPLRTRVNTCVNVASN